MSFQVKEPILVVGLGGVGSKLAAEAKNSLKADCLIISNDSNDFQPNCDSIKITTDSIVNPSVQLIRGSAFKSEDHIKSKISSYSSVILFANLAGKSGTAIAPVFAGICKESQKEVLSFAIMPFKYEKDRVFNSGIALKRIRADSACTIVLDNDALLESNPDLSVKSCYDIGNSAVLHIINSLNTSEISEDSHILSSGKNTNDIEESLRDSLKMLYENAPPNSIKSSILYVVGGQNVPVGILNAISNLTSGINEASAQIDANSSDESKIVMLSSVAEMTKFEKYDPLGTIPQENTLDWSTPDCSIDCKIDLYQLE